MRQPGYYGQISSRSRRAHMPYFIYSTQYISINQLIYRPSSTGIVGGGGIWYLPRRGVGTAYKVPWPAFVTQKRQAHHGKGGTVNKTLCNPATSTLLSPSDSYSMITLTARLIAAMLPMASASPSPGLYKPSRRLSWYDRKDPAS